ncbi:MAG: hypothetical protein AB8B69_26930 [Chitinophagales bacterium]
MNKQNKDSQHVEQEVLKTLENLDSLPKLKAHPSFGTRVEAKIDRFNTSKQANLKTLWQPILLRAAMVFLLVGLNGLVLVNTWGTDKKTNDSSQQKLTINDFISEYGLNSNSKNLYPSFQ